MQCRYTKMAQRIFKYSDIQYTGLTLDKILNSLIYRTLFYLNTYGSYKLLKTVRFFWPTLYIHITAMFHTIKTIHCTKNSTQQLFMINSNGINSYREFQKHSSYTGSPRQAYGVFNQRTSCMQKISSIVPIKNLVLVVWASGTACYMLAT